MGSVALLSLPPVFLFPYAFGRRRRVGPARDGQPRRVWPFVALLLAIPLALVAFSEEAPMDVIVYLDPSPRGEWALAPRGSSRRPGRPAAPRRHRARTSRPTRRSCRAHGRARRARPGRDRRARGRRNAPSSRRPLPAVRSRDRAAGRPRRPRAHAPRLSRGDGRAPVRAPVLVARRPGARVDRVLAALSGRRSTEAVLDAALAWEERTGARAAFVHVARRCPSERRRGRPRRARRDRELDPVLAVLPGVRPRGRLQLLDGLVVEECSTRSRRGVRAARGWRPQRGRRRLRPRGRHRASAARLPGLDPRRPGQRPAAAQARVLTAGALSIVYRR